jgi:hypothetical protein
MIKVFGGVSLTVIDHPCGHFDRPLHTGDCPLIVTQLSAQASPRQAQGPERALSRGHPVSSQLLMWSL